MLLSGVLRFLSRLHQKWQEIWRSPNPVLLHAGARAELSIARVRLLVLTLVLLIPLQNLAAGGERFENLVGVAAAGVALLLALILFQLVRRGLYPTWLGMLLSLLDSLLVTGALATFLALGQPHTAVNSKVIFPTYFLVLGATCLRYDPRICLLTGAGILIQYAALVCWADCFYDLNSPEYAPFVMGMFSWRAQVGRLILLGAGTLLATAVAMRSRELLIISTQDPLTGLLNRREFDKRLREEELRARRYLGHLTVAMIDVDDFKRLNDCYGHRLGDQALRLVAVLLRQAVREVDLVARYGGDEFVILFLEAHPHQIEGKLRAINEKIRAASLSNPVTEGVQLGISFGLAGWPEEGDTLQEVLALADQRLYQSKRKKKPDLSLPEGLAGPS